MVYLVVGIAGLLGALSRYYLGLSVSGWWHDIFPLATLVINLVGCFILSWFSMYVAKLGLFHPYMITAVSTGFVGSFTTFSTFSVETIQLIQASRWEMALLYILSSLWGGLFMSWLGYRMGNFLIGKREKRKTLKQLNGGSAE